VGCAGATESITWGSGSASRSVAFSYDGVSRRFTYADHSWDTAAGNVFVLDFDVAWNASGRQVPAVVTSTDPAEVFQSIVAVAPDLEAARTRGGS
jgi:hypothetical protein